MATNPIPSSGSPSLVALRRVYAVQPDLVLLIGGVERRQRVAVSDGHHFASVVCGCAVADRNRTNRINIVLMVALLHVITLNVPSTNLAS